MKLKDLREDLYGTTRQDINVNRELNHKQRGIYNDNEKSGAFSSVSDKKTDPFMVRKTSHDHKNKFDVSTYDGYWTYIEGIVENSELKNNPFFPRVYNIKKLKDINGKVTMRADLEKLQHGNRFDMAILLPYLENLLSVDFGGYEEDEDVDRIIMEAAAAIESAVDYNDYSSIKNSYLIKALKYIHSLSKDYVIDIHAGNIMFRMGSHGIQLVIIDPLANKRK